MVIEIGNKKRSKKLLAGDRYEPRVLASVGISSPDDSPKTEVEKAKIAQKYGADIIIDHTLTGLNYQVQEAILNEVDIPVSSIAVYDVAQEVLYSNDKEFFTARDVLSAIEKKARLGIDMVTVHASVLKDDIAFFNNTQRIIPCTSRGGTMVLDNMQKSGDENYYFTHFDEILDICKEYGVTVSLGSIFRPATINDAINCSDKYWEEIERNAILAKKATEKGVCCMVEGIGHCPINLIPEFVKKSKEICKVPYRVLTVSTDSALGFDHVASAIAASVATMNGADFITAVSRSEHLGLPSIDDLKEAVISAKIAAHAGYIGRNNDIALDKQMAVARSQVGCKGSFDASIVPEMTKEALMCHKLSDDKKCTMCGEFCALSSGDKIKRNDKKN